MDILPGELICAVGSNLFLNILYVSPTGSSISNTVSLIFVFFHDMQDCGNFEKVKQSVVSSLDQKVFLYHKKQEKDLLPKGSGVCADKAFHQPSESSSTPKVLKI